MRVYSAPWLILAATLVLFGLVYAFVDLTPHVDQHFFFSSNDAQLQESNKIDQRFPSGSQLILSVSSADISSERYLDTLRQLTGRIASIRSVNGVRSLADGPDDFADAEASPFWKRLLIAENQRSSNVIVLIPGNDTEPLIRNLESIVHEIDRKDFRIRIARAPYVVAMIRRSLLHDFIYFSLAAFGLFGVTMWWVFRSGRLFIGMLATCTSAVLSTLLVQSLFGGRIGVLTVNLGTIVFVIALSHLVYMTFNWQTLAQRTGKTADDLATAARRMTFPASFWSMVCASLGFGSLLFVQAKPLRELGFGGVLGSAIALLCAYLMYPAFLRWAVPRDSAVMEMGPGRRFWSRRFVPLSTGVIVVSLGLGLGLTRLNTDPNLLEYFKPHQELRDGLEYVDRNGGSNPLTLVVAAADGSTLNSKDAYKQMWGLQTGLEDHKGVGTVVSLPVLMAEGRRRHDCQPVARAALHVGRRRASPRPGRHHFCTGHERLHRHGDRFDGPPDVRRSAGRARREDGVERVGVRTRGAVARNCLFGRDHCSRLCDFRSLGLPTDPALWIGRRFRHDHRHPGELVRSTAARWCRAETSRRSQSQPRVAVRREVDLATAGVELDAGRSNDDGCLARVGTLQPNRPRRIEELVE